MTVTLPKKIPLRVVSSRSIADIMRARNPKFANMFAAGQEELGHYYLPPFQRPAAWTKNQSAKLIESLIIGMPIGSIIVTNKGEFIKNKYSYMADWIIDGQQRLRAIDAYLKDELTVFAETESEHVFSQLNRAQQLLFNETMIGLTVLNNCTEEYLREIYNRINFDGKKHTEDQRA